MTTSVDPARLNQPVHTLTLAHTLVAENRVYEARIKVYEAELAAGRDPGEKPAEPPRRLKWSEFGMLAFIELYGDPSVRDLEDFADNGVEGMRHLLRQLRKRGSVKLTRHLNERKQFVGGTYSIVRAA